MVKRTPGVVGGSACIGDTRIAVWMLTRMSQLGMCETEIMAQYPGLAIADVREAERYYHEHMAEIEADITENEGGVRGGPK